MCQWPRRPRAMSWGFAWRAGRSVAGGEFAGGLVVLGDDDIGGDADVRLVEHLGRLERGAVPLDRLPYGGRADVVVRGEAQTVAA
ncbi:hypothetical protein [Streptomyces sp. NPDC057580]|uniref:hypothetical protein n=1 Tax=Streptomyces sp. NPDC057580 TaxID=3346173 RepID=UPI0036A8A61C